MIKIDNKDKSIVFKAPEYPARSTVILTKGGMSINDPNQVRVDVIPWWKGGGVRISSFGYPPKIEPTDEDTGWIEN